MHNNNTATRKFSTGWGREETGSSEHTGAGQSQEVDCVCWVASGGSGWTGERIQPTSARATKINSSLKRYAELQ